MNIYFLNVCSSISLSFLLKSFLNIFVYRGFFFFWIGVGKCLILLFGGLCIFIDKKLGFLVVYEFNIWFIGLFLEYMYFDWFIWFLLFCKFDIDWLYEYEEYEGVFWWFLVRFFLFGILLFWLEVLLLLYKFIDL